MKIPQKIPVSTLVLLSPSKTQSTHAPRQLPAGFTPKRPRFSQAADRLSAELEGKPSGYFASRENLRDEKAREIQERWSLRSAMPEIPAGFLYRGPAFTALDYPSIADGAQAEGPRLGILSALYGLLRAEDLMRAYRLDFSYRDLKIDGLPLLDYWKQTIRDSLSRECWKLFIDLSSGEFSPLIPGGLAPVIRIDFKEWRRGAWRSVSATAKQLRGEAARWILTHPGASVETLMTSEFRGHRFNADLSQGNLWVYSHNGPA